LNVKVQFVLLAGAAFAAAAAAQQPAQPAPAPVPSAKSAPAGAEEPLSQGEGRAVALKLADDLVSSFVYRDQAEAYAAMLRGNASSGRYDGGRRGDLAKLLTDDLQAVHKDGHLRVSVAEDRGGAGLGPRAQAGIPRNFPPLIQSAKTIAPGIGYIRFTAFMGRDEELAAIRKWLAENRDAETLIFDLRNHHGGGLDEMDVIFPYLFAERTPLVKMAVAKHIYDQGGVPVGDRPTMQTAREGDQMVDTHSAIPGEDMPLRRAKVYLLVSNASASAAEHFALALKSTGRATLIGEATAGANHFGGEQPLTEHFAVWMPVGRTYDIKTGKDWEGVGIEPDVAVDPTQALIVALEKSGLSHEQAIALNATEVPAEPVHRDKLRAR
jgi:hypothetical protein